MASPIDEWCRAVHVLIKGTDNETRSQADKWLQAFQKKVEVWSVADQVLHRSDIPQEAHYMAANTLRCKILYDFDELPSQAARSSFRDSLLVNVTNFANGSQLVRTRLALCLASVVVHSTGMGEWTDAIPAITTRYGSNPELALVLLDILTVIPEECANKKLNCDEAVRRQAAANLASHTGQILKIIQSFLNSTGTNRDLQKKVLRCFLSWVRHGGVSPEELATNPLFKAVFDALSVPELFEVACDVLVELIHLTEDIGRNLSMIEFIIPRALNLGGLFEKFIASQDDERVRKLSHIFIQMGESYLPLIVQGSPRALEIVSAILKCASCKKDVASNTFNFFYLLSYEIDKCRKIQQGATTKPGTSDRLVSQMTPDKIPLFNPYFTQMVELLRRVMRYPDGYESLRPEARGDSKSYRYFAAETLLDTTGVLGSNAVLNQIFLALQKELAALQANPNAWQGVEACLYCVRSIARRVDRKESNVVPQVMQLMPQFSQNAHLRYTATLIVGRYSDWINEHPHYLAVLLRFVVEGLNEKSVASSAALAFKHVCDGCAPKLATPEFFENLFAVYMQSSFLPFQDHKELIEGFSSVLCALPPDQVPATVERMVVPVATELQQRLMENPQDPDALQSISSLLTKIAEIFRSLDPMPKTHANQQDPSIVPKSLVRVLEKIWPLLERTVELFKADDLKMEKVCRCWKYAIKTSRLHFAPMLKPLIMLMCNHFQTTPHSSFLYTVRICVDHFGPHRDFHPLLLQALEIFSKHSLALLKNSECFTNCPDIAEDYFEMMSRYIKRCPELLFTNPLLAHVVQCALLGLAVHHREACSAVMQFFGLLINEGIDNPKVNAKRSHNPMEPRPPNPAHVQALGKLLEQFGQQLMTGLLLGVAGRLPYDRLRYVIAVIESLIAFHKTSAHGWIAGGLPHLPDTRKFPKEQFLRTVVGAQNMRVVRQAFVEMAQACRRAQVH